MRRFPTYPGCPVCGEREVNPASLEMLWWWDDKRATTVGHFVPTGRHTGYAGRLHGGLLSALLDECLAWACAVQRRTYCVTGELTVRFKSQARLGDELEITGRVESSWGPYQRAVGEVRSSSGELVATAKATFAQMPREEAITMRAALRFLPGDIDVLDPAESPPRPA